MSKRVQRKRSTADSDHADPERGQRAGTQLVAVGEALARRPGEHDRADGAGRK